MNLVISIISVEINTPKIFIGNDGRVKIVTADSIVYDTLNNGKLIARNLPGEIYQIPVDDNETYLRTNFSKSDNRNYRDGDKKSTRYFQSFSDDEDEDKTNVYAPYILQNSITELRSSIR